MNYQPVSEVMWQELATWRAICEQCFDPADWHLWLYLLLCISKQQTIISLSWWTLVQANISSGPDTACLSKLNAVLACACCHTLTILKAGNETLWLGLSLRQLCFTNQPHVQPYSNILTYSYSRYSMLIANASSVHHCSAKKKSF